MFDVICIGGAVRDIFFEVPEVKVDRPHNHILEPHLAIPYGEKIVSKHTFYDYGGSAVNTAVCFSRLGLKAASVCNIGSEGSGDMVVKYLKKEKVNTKFVQRDKILHTGLSVFILGNDGEHTGFLERGANDHLRIKSFRDLKNTKWLYIGSLTGNSERVLPQLFSLAEKNNIKIAFNPGSQQLAEGWSGLKDYIKNTDILILNTEEAERLTYSKTRQRPKNETELLGKIKEMGANISVITEGEIGSHVIFDGHIFHQGAFPKNTVDTTGAGDAFGATFVFGAIKNFDLQYCLKIASINSASVVEKMGSGKGLLSYATIKKSKWL